MRQAERHSSPTDEGPFNIDAEETPSNSSNDTSEAEDNDVVFHPSTPTDAEQRLHACIDEDIKKWCHSTEERPSLSYARLAALAIYASPKGKCTVGEIYAYVEQVLPFYQGQGSPYWKVSGRGYSRHHSPLPVIGYIAPNKQCLPPPKSLHSAILPT